MLTERVYAVEPIISCTVTPQFTLYQELTSAAKRLDGASYSGFCRVLRFVNHYNDVPSIYGSSRNSSQPQGLYHKWLWITLTLERLALALTLYARARKRRLGTFPDPTRIIMPKTKRLTVRELRSIAKELKTADLDVVQQVVIREVQKEQHVHFFQDRKALWCYST